MLINAQKLDVALYKLCKFCILFCDVFCKVFYFLFLFITLQLAISVLYFMIKTAKKMQLLIQGTRPFVLSNSNIPGSKFKKNF